MKLAPKHFRILAHVLDSVGFQFERWSVRAKLHAEHLDRQVFTSKSSSSFNSLTLTNHSSELKKCYKQTGYIQMGRRQDAAITNFQDFYSQEIAERNRALKKHELQKRGTQKNGNKKRLPKATKNKTQKAEPNS